MTRKEPDVDIRLLGPLEVRVDGVVREVNGRLKQSILGFMALHAGSPLDSERLIEVIWGESAQPGALGSLRVHLSQLRKSLDADGLIETVSDGYVLNLSRDAVDVNRFEGLAAKGRRHLSKGDIAAANTSFRAAAAEWRGDPLSDLSGLAAVQDRIAQLNKVHDELLVDLAEVDLEQAGASADVAALESLVLQQPFDERVWGLLMKSQYWAGRQADALETFKRASQVLGEELGLEPGPALRELEDLILTQDRSVAPPPERVVELPTFPTSFVGRVEQVTEVVKLVSDSRLVTIVGLGGAGKTRLAAEAATAASNDFAGGVVFAGLERVTDESLVVEPLAEALGATENTVESVVSTIGDRRILVVLDNCEHLVDSVAAMVSTLLRQCPRVGILATSRVPLGVMGETPWSVPPLDIPESDDLADVVGTEAAVLFVERARQVNPSLVVGHDDAPHLAGISRMLAGMPLAIELAAAQAHVLSLGDIARRLGEDNADSVAPERDRPERHHSIDSTLEWSLDLLDTDAVTLFRRLSVFRDDFDFDAIARVCVLTDADEEVAVAPLAALVEATLVNADVSGETTTYRLLPPIRQVARSLLDDVGESSQLSDRHAAYFAALTTEAAGSVGGPDEPAAMDRLDAVLDDIRITLGHSTAHDPEQALGMVAALSPYWLRRGLHREGRRWAADILALDFGGEPPPEMHAAALHAAGSLAFDDSDLDEAEELLERALEIRRRLGDRRAQGLTLNNLAGVVSDAGDHRAAYGRWLEVLELFEAEEFDLGVASTRINLGIAGQKLGMLDAAAEHFEAALDLTRRIGNRALEAMVLERSAMISAAQGDDEKARALSRAALLVNTEVGSLDQQGRSRWNLAVRHRALGDVDEAGGEVAEAARMVVEHHLFESWWVAALLETAAALVADSEPELGARFLGLAGSQRQREGLGDSQATLPDLEDVVAAIRDSLGKSAYSEERVVGEALSVTQAMEDLAARWK